MANTNLDEKGIFQMIKKSIICIFIIALLSGCSLVPITTTVITPLGDIYTVKSKSDALVEFQDGNKKLIVDNRGRPGMIEQALGIMFMNLPDVTVGTSGVK